MSAEPTGPAEPGEPPQVVLVTGAGTGIGRATARAFARRGARVVAVGRRAEPLRATAAGHAAIGVLPADVSAPGAPAEVVAEVLRRHGRLDVLVNNAGIARAAPLPDVEDAAAAAQFATNVLAPLLLARAALPALGEARGHIVNVSSVLAQRAMPGSSVYAATKAALDSLTRSWAMELAPSGVRVNAVSPGAIDTPIGEHSGLSAEAAEELRRWQVSRIPQGRIGRPEEVARVVAWLAEPAAAYITGVVLPVDGGAVLS